MSEFLESHQRLPDQDLEHDSSKRKYKSEKEWEQSSLIQKQYSDDSTEEDTSNWSVSPILASLEAMLTAVDRFTNRFVKTIIDRYGSQAIEPPESRKKRVLIWMVGVCCISIMMLFSLTRVGIINIQTRSFQISVMGLISLAAALGIYYKYIKTGSLSGIFRR